MYLKLCLQLMCAECAFICAVVGNIAMRASSFLLIELTFAVYFDACFLGCSQRLLLLSRLPPVNRVSLAYRLPIRFACSAKGRVSLSPWVRWIGEGCLTYNAFQMSTEIRNWDVVAKAMEAAGATSSQMYIRAKALAEGKLDPMPTSFPEAPYSISAVAGWSFKKRASHLWGFTY